MRAGVALLLCVLAGTARGQDAAPVIREIAFEGNEITRGEVMLRETVIKPGDPADPAAIERSRQGIQDLGLFKSVDVRQTPVDGGVRVTFVVREKWYIIPIPRFDANSEGENAVGVSLRWFNVAGHNHTLRGNWTRRDEAKANKGETTSWGLGYSMPFVYDTPFGLGFAVGHSESPITDFGGYLESVDSASMALSRSFAKGPASQGWNGSFTLDWTRQRTEGPAGTPDPYGEATAPGLAASYRDIRYNLYSEDGVFYGGAVSGAMDGAGSDYGFLKLRANGGRYFELGEMREHQNLNFFVSAGSYHGGPLAYETTAGAFSLGGASVMRAYPADFVVGDFFYHVTAEYLRPVFENWLRGVIVAEAGNAFPDASEPNDRVYGSIGIGLRLRLTFLVNVEVEAGVAWPLDGGGQRFFASKV